MWILCMWLKLGFYLSYNWMLYPLLIHALILFHHVSFVCLPLFHWTRSSLRDYMCSAVLFPVINIQAGRTPFVSSQRRAGMSTFLLREEKLGETTISPSPLTPLHCETWEKKSHSSAPFTSNPPLWLLWGKLEREGVILLFQGLGG